MSDILCIGYSRSGKTGAALKEIGEALDAEVVLITDGIQRGGWRGFLRSGLDAMKKTGAPLLPFHTKKSLSSYRLVIVGTPIWAGRCCSIVRTFLRENGKRLSDVAYVLTRGGEEKYEEVYDQMDRYLPKPHVLAVSLRSGSVGYHFWQEEFLRQIRGYLTGKQ